jgi:hypothetical protein
MEDIHASQGCWRAEWSKLFRDSFYNSILLIDALFARKAVEVTLSQGRDYHQTYRNDFAAELVVAAVAEETFERDLFGGKAQFPSRERRRKILENPRLKPKR